MDKNISGYPTLKGIIHLPPDKSIAHRAAMFASIADGISEIHNFSKAEDPQTTISCFRQMGVRIEQDVQKVTIYGTGRYGLKKSDAPIDCGNSGTTMRLLAGILAGAGIEATLIGDASLSNRPMKRIIVPLSHMGAAIESAENGLPPLKFKKAAKLNSIKYELPIASAQVKSCVMLAGLFTDNDTTVIEKISSRNHTELLLGLPVRFDVGNKIISSNNNHIIPLQNYTIPGDFSAAAFWLVAGSVYPDAEIQIPSCGVNPTRTASLKILRRMGADVELCNLRKEGPEEVADIRIRSSKLKPVQITPDDIPNCIDELPILSVAMMFANGVSEFRGAEELRHKESDRLKAISEMIKIAGGRVAEHADGLTIYGDPHFRPLPAKYETWHDHRIAMSAAILAGMGKDLSLIRHAECTSISYPAFWGDFGKLASG